MLLALALFACTGTRSVPFDDRGDPGGDTDLDSDTGPESGTDSDGDGAFADVDCDDTDPEVHPGASEVCNDVDDDCDALVDGQDDDLVGAPTWYEDADGDGFGDSATPEVACNPPPGFVADDGDCDAAAPAVHPGAPEVCNDIDDDCDGLTDGQDPDVTDATTWYTDADGDGYGDPGTATTACTQPPGAVANGADPDDLDPSTPERGCTAVTPTPSAWEVWAPGDPIAARFSADMDASTLDTTSFVVYGEISGFIPGSVAYDASARTATFTPLVDSQVGEKVTAVLTAQVLCASGGALDAHVWTFNAGVAAGTGAFVETEEPTTGCYTYGVHPGDFDGDGDLELLTVELRDDELNLLDGSGGAGFTIVESIPTGHEAYFADVGDYDGDGDLDIASVAYGDDEVWIHENDGTGHFSTRQQVAVGTEPRSIQAGDMDGDGDLDLVVGCWWVAVQVYTNDGSGSFTLTSTAAASTSGGAPLQLADLDGDFDLDVALPVRDGGTLEWFDNDGAGALTAVGSEAVGTGPYSTYANDFDGDGDADVAAGLQYGDGVAIAFGDGASDLTYSYSTGAVGLAHFVVGGDVDADGDIDLGVPSWDQPGLRTYLNDGVGRFSQDFYDSSLPDRGSNATFADLDGDGALDLVVATAIESGSGNIVVYLNTP